MIRFNNATATSGCNCTGAVVAVIHGQGNYDLQYPLPTVNLRCKMNAR